MRVDNGIVAYEMAHNKYMEWVSESVSQRHDWVTAYETIETLLGLQGISCNVDTTVCGREYKITVYIENERFDFTFTY